MIDEKNKSSKKELKNNGSQTKRSFKEIQPAKNQFGYKMFLWDRKLKRLFEYIRLDEMIKDLKSCEEDLAKITGKNQ